jgi:hypothetical protein
LQDDSSTDEDAPEDEKLELSSKPKPTQADLPSSEESQEVRKAAPATSKKKLGMIGGRRPAVPEPPSAPEATSGTSESAPSEGAPEKPKKAKLGLIGGKRKVGATSEKPTPIGPGSGVDGSVIKSNNEIIEKASEATSTTESSASSSRPQNHDQSKRETSQERADRKREQLRKQLDSEPPAKKKKAKRF